MALCERDRERVKEINKVTEIIKEKITPLIEYIKNDLFNNESIMSQELVVNKKENILAKCDLSSKSKVLKLKSYEPDLEKIKYQLCYESQGRDVFILQTTWNTELKKSLIFTIYKVNFLTKSDIESNKEEKEKATMNKRMKTLLIRKKVCTYFNTTGSKCFLRSMKFYETDDFNYKYLKVYINTNNVNIQELSKNLEVSENSVKNWINGKSKPYVWNAIAMCVWLDVDEKKVVIKKSFDN